MVMKEKEVPAKLWISFRVKSAEYKIIHGHFSKTTCRKLSEYARNILLQKPVTIKIRNQSADELREEMLQIKKELNAIGNNYNQAVKKLHTLDHIPEIKNWLMNNKLLHDVFMEKTNQVSERMNQIYHQWLSE